jgi:branched-chain amino acid transport system substrate-binding protein
MRTRKFGRRYGPRLVALGAATMLAVTAAACSSSGSSAVTSAGSGAGSSAGSGSSGGSSSPFLVYVSAGLTGNANATQSNQSIRGIQAAAAVLNAKGGILGHQVVVKIANDTGDPSVAVGLLDKQLSSQLPNLVIPGAPPLDVGPALTPILTSHKVLSCTDDPTATQNQPSKFPYAFNIIPSITTEDQALATLVKAKGITKVGILMGNDAFGQGEQTVIAAALKADGITVTGTQTYNDTATNMVPQLTALKAGNPTAVIFDGSGSPIDYILQGFSLMNWNVEKIGGPATLFSDIASQVPAKDYKGMVAEGLAISKYLPPAQQSAALSELLTQIKKSGPINQPISAYAFFADCVLVTAQAAQQAGSLDSAKIAAALEDLGHTANPLYVSMPYEGFSAASHLPTTPANYFRFVTIGPLVDGMVDGQ